MNTDADSTVLTDDVTVAITADTGQLEHQANALVRSLSTTIPDATVVVFVPSRSISELADESLALFEEQGTLVSEPLQLPDYPISGLIQAFVAAEARTTARHLVALDTDTVVLNPPQCHGDGDVWVRPADTGAQYWATSHAHDDWDALCDHVGVARFRPSETLHASVDGQSIPPYWNSGVVVTTDRTLPERWLTYTTDLYQNDQLPVADDEFFLDQIALALAVRDNEVSQLGELQNYPLGGRLSVPADVEILHYGDTRNLARVTASSVEAALEDIWELPAIGAAERVQSLLDVASTHSGRVLSYTQKQRVRRLTARVLPQLIYNE